MGALASLRLDVSGAELLEESVAVDRADRTRSLAALHGQYVVIRAADLTDDVASALLSHCWDAEVASVSMVVRSPAQLVRICSGVASQAPKRPLCVILNKLEPVHDLLVASVRERSFPPYLSLTMRELFRRWRGETVAACLRAILASGYRTTTAERLAKHANVGRATLFRKLRSERVSSPARLVDGCRVASTAVLIRCGEYSDAEIASAIGYASPKQLSGLLESTCTSRARLILGSTRSTQTLGLLDDLLPHLDRIVCG